MGSFSAASYWGCPSSGLCFVQDHLQGLLLQQAIGQFPFVGSFFAVIYWGNPICNPICGVFSCSKLLGMFQKKLTCCQASLHKRGVGGAQPPRLQTYCSHGDWKGSKKTLIMHGGLQKRLRGCRASLHTALNSGGLGGAQPTPFANRMLARLKDSYAVKQACASGGWWGTPPPVCKHTARMVNGAVSIRLISMHGKLQKRHRSCQASLHTA